MFIFLDLPLLNYFYLENAALNQTRSITLSNVPFTNGQHTQHNIEGKCKILKYLTSSGITSDSSIFFSHSLIIASTRLRDCILNHGSS